MVSEKKLQILKFIYEYKKKNDISPSIREIAKGVNLSSIATVANHIDWLKEHEYISSKHSIPRSLKLTEKGLDLLKDN